MGDTAVDFFLETLKQLITSSELSLIIQERHQLESLEEEIMYLRGFLKDTEKKRNDHPEVMQLVMQIRDLVSEAENIVELFVVHAFRTHNRVPPNDLYLLDPMSSIMKTLSELEKLKDQLDLKSVEKEMKTLTAEVKKIYDMNMYDINGVAVRQLIHSTTESGGEVIDIDPVHEIVESQRGAREVNEMEYQNTNAQIGSTFLELARGLGSSRSRERNTSKAVKEKVVVGSKAVKEKLVVGFEKDLEKLIGNLSDKGKGIPLEIISIIGAGGGGKTTLAREVYDHPFTSHTFDLRAWINISQHYDRTRKRDLLFRILEQIKQKKREDYEKSGEDKLGEDVLKCLKGRKYLIAMDDIWGIEAWNDIQRSFPKECNGSKVLFTSRLHIQSDSVDLLTPFSYLLNLETLNIDLRFKGEFIELPRDIFKMVKLRHLYSKDRVFTFHHSSEETWEIDFDRSSKLNSLQTLHQVCACKVCQSFLKCTPNVRKLGLCRVIIREGVSWFPNQEFFECLTKLTISAIFGSASFVDSTLLPRLNLPLTITRITLKNTCLMWEQLSLLQTLPSLEVLRLIEHACLGQVWDTSELDIGFRQLKYLRLYLLGIEKLYAHEDQFPNLEVLVLERCSILEQIPIAFGDLCELREIKLVACRRSVEESARVIQEQQRNRKGDDDCLNLLSRFLIE
ncbi:hypothetical protein Vadar_003210 [Vaccinium darrowii]|uniref:Uncharacterized protein n=1 Tax=Vaccinium darrowii TaxID=229202 RepID=A0ACB7XW57_9ERIC|nr:hypothetical protein Vadar_003210 [Vaccinium darrowii]